MNALPRQEAPHNTKELGKIVGRIVIAITILICVAYLKLREPTYEDGYLNKSQAHTRKVVGKVPFTTQWSEPQSGGLPWALEQADLPYIVEYSTTQHGVVSETIPPRLGRDPNWEPVYKNPEATSVRFRLPEGLGVERATILLYSR